MALSATHVKKEAHRKPIRVLILTKKNSEYGHEVNFRSGLNNTALFLAEELHDNLHINTHFVACQDGNQIDKEIHHYKPTHVVLEAIWVTPDKLREIQKLHRKVIFTIRVHSKITFLAYEGNAVKWIKQFPTIPNVYVSFNAKETYEDFQICLPQDKLAWLPNIYKKIDSEKISVYQSVLNFFKKPKRTDDCYIINVACFGAIRPMKDILLQGFAAIKFADKHRLKLRFHVNGNRIEQSGDATLKNLRALFENTRHELVEHPWMNHSDFIELIKSIDLGMQVSMNESFNVVTADYVYNFKPIVVSEEIHWVSVQCKTLNNVDAIVRAMERVIHNGGLLKENLNNLHAYNQMSLDEWHRFLIETEL